MNYEFNTMNQEQDIYIYVYKLIVKSLGKLVEF